MEARRIPVVTEGSYVTPPKTGWKTTEFWRTLAIDAGVLTAAIAGVLPPKYAAIAAAVSSGAYALGRGFAKLRL